MCYYGTWAARFPGVGKFTVNDVNTTLCTHLMYAFAGINEEGEMISLDPQLDLSDNGGQDNFRKFTALKLKNPKLKTILSVGGWNEGSRKYSKMAGNATLRANFIRTAMKVLLDCGFDGLDMDWEYPTARDTVYGAADVDHFTQLLTELKYTFEPYGLLLTAAVAAVKNSASVFYDIPAISKYLDYINIMTYDLHGSWDDVTGYNAALFRTKDEADTPLDSLFIGQAAIEFWISAGAPRNKILMGVPGAGITGPFSGENGTIGYNEFCDEQLKVKPWNVVYDNYAQVPYAYLGNDWVSYDNVRSIVAKTEYIKNQKLAGVMIWSIETDDFHPLCGKTKSPLLFSINCALGRI
ncbi:hypothetical protein ACJJTC_000450 [Scirpophaga incertulas]